MTLWSYQSRGCLAKFHHVALKASYSGIIARPKCFRTPSFSRAQLLHTWPRGHFSTSSRGDQRFDDERKGQRTLDENRAESDEQDSKKKWNRLAALALPVIALMILRSKYTKRIKNKLPKRGSVIESPNFKAPMPADDSNDTEISIDDLIADDSEGDNEESKKAGQGTRKQNSEEDSYYQSLGDESGMVIFSGTSNIELAREVCAHLNLSLSRLHLSRFADGEISVKILDDVRSRDVYIFQSLPAGSDDKCIHSQFMELFLTVSALRRASSERITAVIPYLGYSRQNDVDPVNPKPLAVADVSNILYTLGVDRVIFVDHHAPRATAFFPDSLPVTNVSPHRLAIRYLTKLNLQSPVVVSTENTGTERAKLFWSRLKKKVDNTGLATIVTNRPRHMERTDDDRENTDPAMYVNVDGAEFSTGQEGSVFIGDVCNRDCVIVDNIVDSGIRVSSVANACRAAGARRIFVYVTHGILSKGAVERLDNCEAEEILVTNTIQLPTNILSNKIRVLNISRLLAEVVRRLHAEALSDFDQKPLGGIGDLYRELDFEATQIEESHNN